MGGEGGHGMESTMLRPSSKQPKSYKSYAWLGGLVQVIGRPVRGPVRVLPLSLGIGPSVAPPADWWGGARAR
jgi:hypothetical protein